ncbi:MAG: V-type ATP synthase subunit B [Elusimicrobia bacterium GWA2_61_42]|nr:MAG: V-type ATP synthase subunit B [Elusimicrobia bacterium GWA2_61_42]OGR76616.1 MAG: V-type ATP synthase subunit B [Elusimicrobia bacterium GWC2_61_25]
MNRVEDRGLEYLGASRIEGPLVVIERVRDAGFDELVEIVGPGGRPRLGRVLEISEERALVQVLEGTEGLSGSTVRARFLGESLRLPVSKSMLGRVFDGLGRPADGGPPPLSGDRRDVNGAPINPVARSYPREFIQTGISAIDGMNSLVRGQKLPIFSGNGLPHDRVCAQLVRQAKLPGENTEFSIVFAAMGVKRDVADFFMRDFAESGALGRVAMFLSLADAPGVERLLTPRAALTLAEHLAFDCGQHVLVVLTDMTNYCESLREVGTARGEIPGRKGYPGYLYSDLAAIYERAGRIEGSPGSITQTAILTMPSDDISHPVPDLTGYITEGQIVLDRELFQRGVYPPIAGLPSLSRLMKDGVGEGYTRADHPALASQLFACYAYVKRVRALADIIGEEELSAADKVYLKFGAAFERRFLTQGEREDRSIGATLDLGWEMLSLLPRDELRRVNEALLEKHYKGKTAPEAAKP